MSALRTWLALVLRLRAAARRSRREKIARWLAWGRG
jgi:hypothetical protein